MRTILLLLLLFASPMARGQESCLLYSVAMDTFCRYMNNASYIVFKGKIDPTKENETEIVHNTEDHFKRLFYIRRSLALSNEDGYRMTADRLFDYMKFPNGYFPMTRDTAVKGCDFRGIRHQLVNDEADINIPGHTEIRFFNILFSKDRRYAIVSMIEKNFDGGLRSDNTSWLFLFRKESNQWTVDKVAKEMHMDSR